MTQKIQTPGDYLKGLALGLTFSIIIGIVLGLAVWYFESIYEIIIVILTLVAAFIPRIILRKPHQLLTMLICAMTALVVPLTIYLTMEIMKIEFESSFYIFIMMGITPLAGLYFGYMNTSNTSQRNN